MTITAAALLALATFLVGLYLGHRWATHDARIEFAQLERRYQNVIGFAEAYIEANAPIRGHTVIRNDSRRHRRPARPTRLRHVRTRREGND